MVGEKGSEVGALIIVIELSQTELAHTRIDKTHPDRRAVVLATLVKYYFADKLSRFCQRFFNDADKKVMIVFFEFTSMLIDKKHCQKFKRPAF